MKKRLVIIGNSGAARECYWLVKECIENGLNVEFKALQALAWGNTIYMSGIEIQTATEKVDCRDEVVPVWIPTGLSFNGHYLTIQPFRNAIAYFVSAICHYVIYMTLYKLANFLHWRQA